MKTPTLTQLHARYGSALDDALDECFLQYGLSSAFGNMMRYQLGYVDERFERVPTGSGKRFRPLLCLLTCEALGGAWAESLPAACGIELLHNFSLIHDDIEDHDPVRRHRPTVWKLWGEPQAINVGDGMFALASRLLLDVRAPAETIVMLAREFQHTATALTEGQYLDMSFETRNDVTVAEYLRMISLKTGALIAYSTWAGAAVAGAHGDTLQLMRAFGEELGRAFQIQDDILGIWAPASRTGKEEAKDLSNRKQTLPVLAARERADSGAREKLDRFYRREDDSVGEVLSVLEATSARRWAEEQVRHHLELADRALRAAGLDHDSRSDLLALAETVTGG